MTSYITELEAETYFAAKVQTAPWDNAAIELRDKALLEATKIINRLRYVGTKTSDDQDNQFPRNGNVSVPQAVKDACAEIALALLSGYDTNKEIENLSVVSEGYSNVKTTYDRAFALEHQSAGVPSPVAWLLLKPYMADVQGIALIRV